MTTSLFEEGLQKERGSLVPFTQYILPNGAKREIFMPTSQEVKDKADAIIKEEYRFEIEILTTGEVSATISDPIMDMDADIVIVDNDPHCIRKICAMIMRFQPVPKSHREGQPDG